MPTTEAHNKKQTPNKMRELDRSVGDGARPD